MPVHGVSDSIPKLLTDTEIFETRAHLPRKRGWLDSAFYKLKILRQLQKVLKWSLRLKRHSWHTTEGGREWSEQKIETEGIIGWVLWQEEQCAVGCFSKHTLQKKKGSPWNTLWLIFGKEMAFLVPNTMCSPSISIFSPFQTISTPSWSMFSPMAKGTTDRRHWVFKVHWVL